MKINVYGDPGHAWAKVKKSTLVKLGIADKITTYSYMRGDYAYLEEDCDLSTLVSALRAAGVPFEFKEHVARFKQSKIRGYSHYSVRV
jgi:hypothetical protein